MPEAAFFNPEMKANGRVLQQCGFMFDNVQTVSDFINTLDLNSLGKVFMNIAKSCYRYLWQRY